MKDCVTTVQMLIDELCKLERDMPICVSNIEDHDSGLVRYVEETTNEFGTRHYLIIGGNA